MNDKNKSKDELLRELEKARERIAELEVLEEKRRQTEWALKENRHKTRAILDQTFQFIGLLTPDGTLIDANRSSLEFGGLSESDVIDKLFWETPWWVHSKELQEKLRDGITRAAKGEFVRFEAFHPTPDGGNAYVDISLKPVYDDAGKVIYVIPEGRDITEKKLTEDEVSRLALAIRHSSELVNMSTMDGVMTFLNDAGSRILGIDPEEVGEHNIMEVIPDHLVELVETELLPALMRGETWKGELKYKNIRTGELTDVHAVTYTVPDPETGEPLFLANVSLDITDIKQAEEEHRALEEQIRHMQKLESLGILAGGIAHDFNNLLTGILGNADLAMLHLSDHSPARKNLEGIEKASIRAADLCKQMLAYSGKGKFVIDVLDLAEVIKEMVDIIEVSVSKKANLTYDFKKGTPPVEADATQLRQIILNLIINASEAIGEELGIITVRVGSQECDREYLSGAFINEDLPAGTYTFLEISDSGSGMDRETIEKIFDPFFTTKFTGRGLGLSAVMGIIRGHNGAIKVYSEPDKGSSFKVFLPATSKLPPDHSKSAAAMEWTGTGTILLVDDEETVRNVGKKMLEIIGFDVLTANDGREALEIFNQHVDEITLVLLDLTMPNMDGEETLHALKRINPDVKVMICSGYNEQDVSQRFVGQGLAGFIQKPFHTKSLMLKLKELLD